MPRTLRSVPALERGLRLQVAIVPFALWGSVALGSWRLSAEWRQLLLTTTAYYLAFMMLHGIWTVLFRRRPLKVSRYAWTFGIQGLALGGTSALIAFGACFPLVSFFDHFFGEGTVSSRSAFGVPLVGLLWLNTFAFVPMTIGAAIGSWILYTIIGTGHRRRLYKALTQARAAR